MLKNLQDDEFRSGRVFRLSSSEGKSFILETGPVSEFFKVGEDGSIETVKTELIKRAPHIVATKDEYINTWFGFNRNRQLKRSLGLIRDVKGEPIIYEELA